MMLCRNTLGAYALYMSMLQANCPIMLVSSGLPEDRCRQILNRYQPAFLLLPEDLSVNYAPMEKIRTFYDYRIHRTNFASHYPLHPELAVMVTTSGATGSVKFVRQSRRNIRADAEAAANFLGVTEHDRMITTMSLIYTYTQTTTRATLLRGGLVIVTEHNVLEDDFWELTQKEHITMLHGVPNIYEIMRRLSETISGRKFPCSGRSSGLPSLMRSRAQRQARSITYCFTKRHFHKKSAKKRENPLQPKGKSVKVT